MIDFNHIRASVPLEWFIRASGIELTQDGKNWRGRCPFHQEKHGASLIVYPDNHWWCQGKCDCGGDIVSFYLSMGNYPDLGSLVTEMLLERLSGQRSHTLASPKQLAKEHPQQPSRAKSKWPEPEIELIEGIVRQSGGLAELAEQSPCRFEDQSSHTEEVIDALFPGNPLLCVALDNAQFATRRREVWRGQLSRMPLIVANPMLKVWADTQSGKKSQHTLAATTARVYLPIEFDFCLEDKLGKPTVLNQTIAGWQREGISVADACAALHLYLAKSLPLVLATHSGGKSLHAWFRVLGFDEQALLAIMRRACRLGADHVTWRPSQFVRMPDGRRQDGQPQVLYYFDPKETVYGSRSPLCPESN